ncbi:MAG TPA: hypothetical protein VJW77_06335 [Terriglobia bacterium]|nr:hypothetical protein [Terriglobia bacterium]
MTEATRPIAIIPGDCFRWQPRVQFIDSFRTREAALTCAFEQGYNLIVERHEASKSLFDVLDDPEGACTSGLELELIKKEEILVDPYTEGWTSLMLSSMSHFTGRLGKSVSNLYSRHVAPGLRHAASRYARVELRESLRYICGSLRQYDISGNARRIALRAEAFYRCEIVPFCRSAASRSWWSDPAIALRRAWRRHSQGSASDVTKRLAAEASVIYTSEITPRLRYTLSRCRQADIQGACRRAWRSLILKGIRLTDQVATVVASLYVREMAPRLRSAAARYQQTDIEGTFLCRVAAVAPSPRSRISRLH